MARRNKSLGSWYAATFVFVCSEEGQKEGPWTVEEEVRLLKAVDKEVAYARALRMGKELAEAETAAIAPLEDTAGKRLVFDFLGLENLDVLDEDTITDGTRVSTNITEYDDYPSDMVHEKKHLDLFIRDEIKKIVPHLNDDQVGTVLEQAKLRNIRK